MKKILLAFALVLLTASAGKKPVTLFLVGDSTMADKTELDISPEVGWGQVFPTFLNDKIVVQNHAMNGRSTKSFQVEGRWQVVLDRMSKGDIVIIASYCSMDFEEAKKHKPMIVFPDKNNKI